MNRGLGSDLATWYNIRLTMASFRYKYLAVEGLVQTGKTRLAEKLAQKLGARLVRDNQNNPFTEEFATGVREGDGKTLIRHQLIHLLSRYHQQLEFQQKGLFHNVTISDYLPSRDGIYAHTVLEDEELNLYKQMYAILSEKFVAPQAVVYLQISFAEMLRRIAERGDDWERQVPKTYWRELFEAYNYYFFNFKACPLLVINMEKADPSEEGLVEQVLAELSQLGRGTHYYAPSQ